MPAGSPPLKSLCSFSQKDAKNILKHGSFFARTTGIKLIEAPFGEKTVLNESHGRILIVIPRKVGPANVRNLIRRRIRSIYLEEKLYSRISATTVFVYPEAKGYSFEQIKAFLVEAFTRTPKKKPTSTRDA